MYRESSPIFDIPEFPTLRRVKPLPKRRRTSAPMPPHIHRQLTQPLEVLSPDATAEELLAHADTLSARMALQSYYMPLLGGVQDFLNVIDQRGGGPPKDAAASDFEAAPGGPGSVRDDEDEHGDAEGDYIDHLQQPGNTKKRKVPANASGSPRGLDPGGTSGEQEPTERGIPTGRAESETPLEVYQTPMSVLGLLDKKRGKLTAATLAGLQHKEMLKSRKRQLAAVLGALSHGDTLALDQALSANYPFATGSGGGFEDLKSAEPPKVRLSKRRTIRLSRAVKLNRQLRHPDAIPFPYDEFTFVCPSATADRLIATKEEVAMLRNRFEAELERQAAKAAKLAAANKMVSAQPAKAKAKRTERTQQRARTVTGGKGGEQTAEFLDQALVNAKSRGKKKKRSALANASNPHHLRNYVPSRLPHSGAANAGQVSANAQNTLSPLPLRFLSAAIPPRRRKKNSAVQPTAQLTNPGEEWICAFCEYDLFYGDEQEYRRAVRNRKKILRRRRRARERAAAAASGNSTVKAAEKGTQANEEYDGGFEPSADEFATVPKQTKLKGDPNKDRERAGEQASFG